MCRRCQCSRGPLRTASPCRPPGAACGTRSCLASPVSQVTMHARQHRCRFETVLRASGRHQGLHGAVMVMPGSGRTRRRQALPHQLLEHEQRCTPTGCIEAAGRSAYCVLPYRVCLRPRQRLHRWRCDTRWRHRWVTSRPSDASILGMGPGGQCDNGDLRHQGQQGKHGALASCG